MNALILESLAAEIERVRKDKDFTDRARRRTLWQIWPEGAMCDPRGAIVAL